MKRFFDIWIDDKPESGKGAEDGDLVVELLALGQFAVFEVAVIPRWISDRTSECCVGIFDRKARAMPVLRGAMARILMLEEK